MKNKKREVIAEAYEDAGPLLRDRTLKFLKALGVRKAKKRVVNVDVRVALNKPPLKDGGLSIARVIRIELKKVSLDKFSSIMNLWRDLPDDEEIDEDDCIVGDEDAFVSGKIDCALCTVYGLDNGGFLVVEFDNDDSPNIFVYLYKDYNAICQDYPSRVVDQLLPSVI
jgi:hypothetical protein